MSDDLPLPPDDEDDDEPRRLLIVEDDAAFARTLSRSFERRGYLVHHASNLAEVEALLTQHTPGYAVVDLKLAGGDSGLACVQALHAHDEDMLIVVLTGYASIATAVDAMRRGAWNYLPKPFDIDALAQSFEAPGEDAAPPPAAPVSLRRQGWEHMQRVLAECGGNVSQAARVLGVDRRTLQRKLAKRPVKERPE